MSHLSQQFPEFAGTQAQGKLWQYIQSMNAETIASLSKPASPEVTQVIESTIVGMLGSLPPEAFNVMITTSRENLGRMLVSATLNGYFLRNAEQRMEFEKSLQLAEASSQADDE